MRANTFMKFDYIFRNDFFSPCIICQYFHLCSADDQRNQPEIEANQLAVDMEANGNATYIHMTN